MKTKFNFLQKFMILFSSTVIFFSCTTYSDLDKNEQASLSFKSEASLIFDSYDTLEKEFDNPISIFRTNEINQESLDEYLNILGLEENYISLENVNHIISDFASLSENDLDVFIEALPYSTQTKGMLLQLSNGDAYDDLDIVDGFAELDISEKELITFSNAIVDEYASRNYDDWTAPCPSDTCTGALVVIGAMIGNTICGLPCGIVGGIVGFLIGGSMKNT